jgi:hypothetical protein
MAILEVREKVEAVPSDLSVAVQERRAGLQELYQVATCKAQEARELVASLEQVGLALEGRRVLQTVGNSVAGNRKVLEELVPKGEVGGTSLASEAEKG